MLQVSLYELMFRLTLATILCAVGLAAEATGDIRLHNFVGYVTYVAWPYIEGLLLYRRFNPWFEAKAEEINRAKSAS